MAFEVHDGRRRTICSGAMSTSSAALAGMLRDHRVLSPSNLTILQGADMGRPARIFVRFEDVEVSPVHVSGNAETIS